MNPRLLQSILLTSIFLTACAKERTIGLKENIHHDDFEYSVRRVSQTKQIGDQHARGTFYVVDFRVENRARRIAHRWDNHIAYVVDEKGRKYENDDRAQAALQRAEEFGLEAQYATSAGQIRKTRLVFELPSEVKAPCLMVRGECLMGDVFDGCQFRKTKVRLSDQ